MHRTNSEERPGIPGSISCEIAAKLEFCLAISDHTVLGLCDMSAVTGFSGQRSTTSGEMGGLSFTSVRLQKFAGRDGELVQQASSDGNDFLLTKRIHPKLADNVSICLLEGNMRVHPGRTDRWSR